jgi:hypothetical protein
VRERQFAEMRSRQEKHNGLATGEASYKNKIIEKYWLSEL